MKISFKLENPNEMNATVTMTMKIGEWKALLEQISDLDRWPIASFKIALRETVWKAESSFSESVERP